MAASEGQKPATGGEAVPALAVVGVALGLVARFLARPGAPLWLDETYTGAIVSQPTFAQFWRLAYWEVSSPLYFLVMRPWQAVFGVSDAALRAPSLIFGLVAPLLIIFARVPGLSRAQRLTWAALLALWIPGIGYAQDARCYSLVLLLATVQTLAFAAMMSRPSLRSAALWVLAADLTIAAHYDGAYLALSQGLIFLAVRRQAAPKTWPAALLVAPVLALVAWQGPEMARYMRADTAWYGTPPLAALPSVIGYALGAPGYLLGLPAFAFGIWLIGRRRPAAAPGPETRDLAWTGCAALLGAGVLIAIGFFRPTLTWRYLAPFEPGLMLGLVLAMGALARDARGTAYLGLLAAGLAIDGRWLAEGARHGDSVYEALNYERASQSLMRAGVRRLVFTWDSPNARAMHPEQLAKYGGFFFRRAGKPVEVIPVRVGAGQDPNALLLAAARPAGAAILWVFDKDVGGTAANSYPPRIQAMDPRWRCTDFAGGKVGVIACIPVQP